MAVSTVDNANASAQDTNRGPSPAVWNDCPVLGILEQNQELSGGMYFFDDFLVLGSQGVNTSAVAASIGSWGFYGSAYASNTLQVTDQSLEGGVIALTSDGADEAVTLLSTSGGFRLLTTSTLAYNKKLWFECRVARATITATKFDMFVGLADKMTDATTNLPTNILPITTTDDTLSTVPNLLGFHSKSSVGNDFSLVYQLAAGTAVYPTNLTTLSTTVAGAAMVAQSGGTTGWIKLGFVFDPNAPAKVISSASTGQTAGRRKSPLLTVYVNGQAAAAFLTSDNFSTAFPTGFMSPVVSVMQTATGSNKGLIDWIRVAQLPNS